MVHTRKSALIQWLAHSFAQKQVSAEHEIKLAPLTGDAGFRNYYRFTLAKKNYIAVDAPPESSNNLGFLSVAQLLAQQGVLTPQVYFFNLAQGFFCLSDLGDNLLSQALETQTVNPLYRQAIDSLLKIQSAATDLSVNDESQRVLSYSLPDYHHEFIANELTIFSEWLLQEHLAIYLTPAQQNSLNQCFDILIDNALAQPQVFMHRDYHSRNMMFNQQNELAIIDFQDAVKGPICYDIVSLLRDCYVRWPDSVVDELFKYFINQVIARNNAESNDSGNDFANIDDNTWQRWFDLMGLQRHLKASGIFARLYHRDHKRSYLKDIPLTLNYIVDISAQYPQLSFLHELVTTQVLPKLALKKTADEAYIP